MRLYLYLFLIIAISACGNADIGGKVVTYYDGDYKHIRKEVYYVSPDEIKHGNYTLFSKQGKPALKGHYINGAKSGVWKTFENGSLVLEETYKNDKRNGAYINYYPENRQIKEEGSYVDGVASGTWKLYYSNGIMYVSKALKDGRFHGKYFRYASNGALLSELFYIEGKLHRIGIMNDAYGNALEIGSFVDGNGTLKKYFSDGTLKEVRNYKDGWLDGLQIESYKNGQKKATGKCLKGKRKGDWSFYNDQGVLNKMIDY